MKKHTLCGLAQDYSNWITGDPETEHTGFWVHLRRLAYRTVSANAGALRRLKSSDTITKEHLTLPKELEDEFGVADE